MEFPVIIVVTAQRFDACKFPLMSSDDIKAAANEAAGSDDDDDDDDDDDPAVAPAKAADIQQRVDVEEEEDLGDDVGVDVVDL